MSFLIIILALWGIGKAISVAQDRKRQAQIARIKAEQRRQREEQARLREDFRREQAEARERAKRQAEIERETVRLAKEQEKQAAQLAKHEKRIADLEYRIAQAEDDIDTLAYRIEEQQRYSVFLQEQRDKCSVDSAEYFKWQNKLSAVDNKVYQLDKQMRKAIHTRDMAKKEMETA